MAGYPTRLAPSGTVPDGTTEIWKDRKRYLWLIGLVVPSLAFVAFGGCVIGLLPADDVARAGDAVRRAFADAGFGEPSLFAASPEAGARRA